MLTKLQNWLNRLFKLRRKRAKARFKLQFVEDIPATVKRNKVYLIGTPDFYWQALMQCPCGCGVILHINLVTEIKPYWKFSKDKDGGLNLHPSIHRLEECKSHFFLKKSLIIWV